MRLIFLLVLQCWWFLGGAAAFQSPLHSTTRLSRRTTITTTVVPAAAARRELRFIVLPARITTTTTQLAAFLPPSGGGDNKDPSGDGLGAVATSVLTFAGITLFFLSPLGGLFFAFFNSILALSILIPVGGFVAFQVWTYLNTVKGNCANCAAPVQVLKDGTPSICLNCGSILQARDGEIYLANPNPRQDIFVDDNVSTMGGWINGQGSLGGRTETRRTTSTTIIDVDVKQDDD